jgi:hypothetical protein
MSLHHQLNDFARFLVKNILFLHVIEKKCSDHDIICCRGVYLGKRHVFLVRARAVKQKRQRKRVRPPQFFHFSLVPVENVVYTNLSTHPSRVLGEVTKWIFRLAKGLDLVHEKIKKTPFPNLQDEPRGLVAGWESGCTECATAPAIWSGRVEKKHARKSGRSRISSVDDDSPTFPLLVRCSNTRKQRRPNLFQKNTTTSGIADDYCCFGVEGRRGAWTFVVVREKGKKKKKKTRCQTTVIVVSVALYGIFFIWTRNNPVHRDLVGS